MADNLTPTQRSACMRAVRGKDTGPEIIVRKTAYALGYRYRIHSADLPGKPDLVFKSRQKVIFVHGCFWHFHTCKRGRRVPATNSAYWTVKRERNRKRDRSAARALRSNGWTVLVVWECWTRDEGKLRRRLQQFLET